MKQLKYGRKRETKIYWSKSETQDGLRIVTAPHVGEQCGMSAPDSHLDQEAAIDELPAIANPRSKDLRRRWQRQQSRR